MSTFWSEEEPNPVNTRERAEQVRRWRVDHEMTWRGVAWAGYMNYWHAAGDNQLAGEEMCRKAAEILGEDPYAEPWN